MDHPDVSAAGGRATALFFEPPSECRFFGESAAEQEGIKGTEAHTAIVERPAAFAEHAGVSCDKIRVDSHWRVRGVLVSDLVIAGNYVCVKRQGAEIVFDELQFFDVRAAVSREITADEKEIRLELNDLFTCRLPVVIPRRLKTE